MSHPAVTFPATLDLPDGRTLHARFNGAMLVLALNGQPLIQLQSQRVGVLSSKKGTQDITNDWHLQLVECDREKSVTAVWAACYWHFFLYPDCHALHWHDLAIDAALLNSGLVANTAGISLRSQFWQLPEQWLRAPASAGYPQLFCVADGVRHPQRPPTPKGEVYRRFDSRLGHWISLRTLDIDTDLERFNRWQNDPRVSAFWEETGSIEVHRSHLQKLDDDPHSLMLIGCFDDQPFGYFEVYWAKEDRLGRYYDADHYDRGMHMLVGEAHHRGPQKVRSWLSALSHYLLLDEPRTQRLVSEPRADNDRMIAYLQQAGFCCQREFDFPHKRAALMTMTRERFFDRCDVC